MLATQIVSAVMVVGLLACATAELMDAFYFYHTYTARLRVQFHNAAGNHAIRAGKALAHAIVPAAFLLASLGA